MTRVYHSRDENGRICLPAGVSAALLTMVVSADISMKIFIRYDHTWDYTLLV